MTATRACAATPCPLLVAGPKSRYCAECGKARRGKPPKWPWDEARDAVLREV